MTGQAPRLSDQLHLIQPALRPQQVAEQAFPDQ